MMIPEDHHRKNMRLQGYDYSQAGGYFVTIVAQGRECLFGEILNDEMIFNEAGKMVARWWNELANKFPSVTPEAFVVMPNHFHGIGLIHGTAGAGLVPAPAIKLSPSTRATTRVAPTLGDIVGGFKSITTHEYISGVKGSGWPSFFREIIATQLLRTYYPKRRGLRAYLQFRCRQPFQMGRG
jgi:putative transposase